LASREQSEEPPVNSGINKIQTTKVNTRSYSLQRSMGLDNNVLEASKNVDGSVMPPINRGLS
jgi:hypothetical protein